MSWWDAKKSKNCSIWWVRSPKLVEDVVPNLVSLGELVGVVRGLLKERMATKDMVTILEAVADASTKSKELPYMIEQTRKRMAQQMRLRCATKPAQSAP